MSRVAAADARHLRIRGSPARRCGGGLRARRRLAGRNSNRVRARRASLSEYIAEADRICADGRVKARAGLAPLGRRAQRDGKVTVNEVMEINRAAVHEVTPMMRR